VVGLRDWDMGYESFMNVMWDMRLWFWAFLGGLGYTSSIYLPLRMKA
jgi:hypothetical protein